MEKLAKGVVDRNGVRQGTYADRNPQEVQKPQGATASRPSLWDGLVGAISKLWGGGQKAPPAPQTAKAPQPSIPAQANAPAADTTKNVRATTYDSGSSRSSSLPYAADNDVSEVSRSSSLPYASDSSVNELSRGAGVSGGKYADQHLMSPQEERYYKETPFGNQSIQASSFKREPVEVPAIHEAISNFGKASISREQMDAHLAEMRVLRQTPPRMSNEQQARVIQELGNAYPKRQAEQRGTREYTPPVLTEDQKAKAAQAQRDALAAMREQENSDPTGSFPQAKPPQNQVATVPTRAAPPPAAKPVAPPATVPDTKPEAIHPLLRE